VRTDSAKEEKFTSGVKKTEFTRRGALKECEIVEVTEKE